MAFFSPLGALSSFGKGYIDEARAEEEDKLKKLKLQEAQAQWDAADPTVRAILGGLDGMSGFPGQMPPQAAPGLPMQPTPMSPQSASLSPTQTQFGPPPGSFTPGGASAPVVDVKPTVQTGQTQQQPVRASWYGNYGNFHDPSDRPGSNALGVPEGQQGIALPSRNTLGQWFNVTTPDGRTFQLQQTDVGPAGWTGRGVDISAAAAGRMGYTPSSFPTDAPFKVSGGPMQQPDRGGGMSDMPPMPLTSVDLMQRAAQRIQQTMPNASPQAKLAALQNIMKLMGPSGQQQFSDYMQILRFKRGEEDRTYKQQKDWISELTRLFYITRDPAVREQLRSKLESLGVSIPRSEVGGDQPATPAQPITAGGTAEPPRTVGAMQEPWSNDPKTSAPAQAVRDSYQPPRQIPTFNYSKGDLPYEVKKGAELPKPQQMPFGYGSYMSTDNFMMHAYAYLMRGKSALADIPTKGPAGSIPVEQQQQLQVAIQNYSMAWMKSLGLTERDVERLRQNIKAWPQFVKGPQGLQIAAAGTVMGHLGTYLKAVEEYDKWIKSGHTADSLMDVPALRNLIGGIAKETGYTGNLNLEALSHIIGAEVERAIGITGGGTEAGRQAAGALFDKRSNLEQARGVVGQVQELLADKMQAVFRLAEELGLDETDIKRMAGPEAFGLMQQSLKKKAGEAPAGAAQRSAEDEAAIKWATSPEHRDDPQAKIIREHWGVE